jgi:hypothetical protein
MRSLLIMGGITILSAGVWTAAADHGRQEPDWLHGPRPRGYGGLQGPMMRHGAGRYVRVGRSTVLVVFPDQLIHGGMELGPVAPDMFAGGLMMGEAEHPVAGAPPGPAISPVAHVPVRAEHGEAVLPQPTVPGASPPDQGGLATAQSGLPGAAGPGQPVSGVGPAAPGLVPSVTTQIPRPTMPGAGPWSPRPPGAAGPGRPLSGRSGPGRPGPGRPAFPRW